MEDVSRNVQDILFFGVNVQKRKGCRTIALKEKLCLMMMLLRFCCLLEFLFDHTLLK
jgi:hypothetical protein